MSTEKSKKDVVKEARELLAKATPRWEQSQLAPAYVISLAEGHEVVMSFGEYEDSGDLAHEFKNARANMALALHAPLNHDKAVEMGLLSVESYEKAQKDLRAA